MEQTPTLTSAKQRENSARDASSRRIAFDTFWLISSCPRGAWPALAVPPNEKAPEVLTTPGASFLGSGGRYARISLLVPLLLPVAGRSALWGDLGHGI
jgi:hypothetical protein